MLLHHSGPNKLQQRYLGSLGPANFTMVYTTSDVILVKHVAELFRRDETFHNAYFYAWEVEVK